MKLKDLLTNVVENKKNGQLNTSIKRKMLKEVGISKEDLLNCKIDAKLKRVLFE